MSINYFLVFERKLDHLQSVIIIKIICWVFIFIVALLYASVGFGGGSSYLALLLLWQVSYASIQSIALLLQHYRRFR